MDVSRRGLLFGLGGIIAAGVAPALIKTPGLIMPIKPKLVSFSEANDINTWSDVDKYAVIIGTDHEGKLITERASVPRVGGVEFKSLYSYINSVIMPSGSENELSSVNYIIDKKENGMSVGMFLGKLRDIPAFAKSSPQGAMRSNERPLMISNFEL